MVIDKEKLKEKIELAKKLAEGTDFEKEVFTAILTRELLEEEHDMIPYSQAKQISKEFSLKEFLISKNPKDDVERTALFGYYLENFRKYEIFNVKDITSCFREAREKVPDNVNDKISKCIGKDWIMESDKKKDDKKAFVMTRTGSEIIERNFAEGKKNVG